MQLFDPVHNGMLVRVIDISTSTIVNRDVDAQLRPRSMRRFPQVIHAIGFISG